MAQDQNQPPLKQILRGIFTLGAVTALVAILIRFLRKWTARKPLQEDDSLQNFVHQGIQGLTEADADALRLEGQDNVVSFEPQRTLKKIIRENLLNIFNLSLLGVASVQFILGLYWDALLSLGVAILNVGIQVGQELFVRSRLDNIVQTTRPQATVIREGQVRSIDPSEIVRGDALVVGPGDQILADGEILSENPIQINESQLTGEGALLIKRFGEPVYAGSYCISGRAAYRADVVGDERLVAKLVADAPEPKKILTPLEKIVKNVLSVMLVIVLILFSLLLVHYFRLDKTIDLDLDSIVSATSVIFSLAPASLFFMIFLNYVSGTMQLAKRGALAHRARSVETLAYASDICVTQASTRSVSVVRMEAIEDKGGNKHVPDSRLRQILGDFGCSNSTDSQAVMALAAAFTGEQRNLKAETTFLSAYGWVASVFNDDDLRGIYILGERQALEPHLNVQIDEIVDEEVIEEEKEKLGKKIQKGFSGLGRFFKSSEKSDQGQIPEYSDDLNEQNSVEDTAEEEDINGPEGSQIEETRQKGISGFFKRVGRSFQSQSTGAQAGDESSPEDKDSKAEEFNEELVYLFAYIPEVIDLYDELGEPQIPDNLQPLCHLYYSNEIRPETVETIRWLTDNGIKLTVVSPGDPDRVVAALQKAHIGDQSNALEQIIDADELFALEGEALKNAVDQNTIISNISPEQAGLVVKIMREDGDTIAVLGGGPSDLPVMQQANLSIAPHGSSQAAMSVADIVLLKESPKVLMKVLTEGQKIVNGLLDVLKLYLTQLIYLVILILLLVSAGYGFPYLSKQGSFIAIVTLALPSIGLSLWALPGSPPKVENIGRTLTWFVAPAAICISLAGMALFIYFINLTGEQAYAQLALTYMLSFSGLMLVLLVRPPTRRIKKPGTQETSPGDSKKLTHDWRPSILILVILLLLIIVTPMRWTEWLFEIDRLRQGSDYLVVCLAVIAWVAVVEIIWRILPPKIYRPR